MADTPTQVGAFAKEMKRIADYVLAAEAVTVPGSVTEYRPEELPPTRAVEFLLPTSHVTGTAFRVAVGTGHIDITAGHVVAVGANLPEALGWPAGTPCVRLARPTALQLPPGMRPEEVDLFDVHLVGPMHLIEQFKAECPLLADVIPNFDEMMRAYGFPYATGFGLNPTGQPRTLFYQTTADETGLLFFKSNFAPGPGMSGAPVGEGGRGVLTGAAYFDDQTGNGPEHWAVVQMLHRAMLLIEV